MNPTIGMHGYAPTEKANRALAIVRSLPLGSGVCPIGVDPRYRFPLPPAQSQVKTSTGGYADYYNVHPVMDVSGLILWNGRERDADGSLGAPGAYVPGGQTQAASLARQILTSNTDRLRADVPLAEQLDGLDLSWSADFNPGDLAFSTKPYEDGPLTTTPDVPRPWIDPTVDASAPANAPAAAASSSPTSSPLPAPVIPDAVADTLTQLRDHAAAAPPAHASTTHSLLDRLEGLLRSLFT